MVTQGKREPAGAEATDPGLPVIHDPRRPGVQRLKPNAVGLPGVIFMAVATAAPITAMVGNVPISVGFGNGPATPASYLVVTVILALAAVGYSSMAREITATGAFYGFISFGLGRVAGLGAGALTTMAYVVFESAIIGIFSFFAQSFFAQHLGIDLPWLLFAVLALAVNAAASYFKVTIAATALGIFLISEIAMLALLAITVLVHGGPEGWSLSSLNPLNAFTNFSGQVTDPVNPAVTVTVTATAGLGLFFAFWSWVGFESAAMYGEESRDPKRIIPWATMLSVIGIGLFYVFVSWAAIVGTGPTHAMVLAQNSDTGGQIFFGVLEQNLGSWAVVLFEFLMMSGSYACCMAFHNCAARYLYAIAREDLIPGLASTVGATHPRHSSPYVAGFIQTGLALVIVCWFAFTGRDPYLQLFALMGLLGTVAIVIVQAVASFSCIAYFHLHGSRRREGHWFRTALAPALGGLGMLFVLVMLVRNASFAAGAAADDLVFQLIPYVVGTVGIAGVGFALAMRRWAPQRYERLGRIILDVRERDTAGQPRHSRESSRR